MSAREWASEQERDAWRWSVSPASEAEQLAWLLLRWRTDPVLYAIECLRTVPLPYQAHILLDLADAPREVFEFYGFGAGAPKRQVIASSGHGLGKTRLEAISIHWHKDTHRFSKTLVTAPTSDQITGQLWGEIAKLHRRQKERWPMFASEWEILGSSIVHKNPDYADWHVLARTARADKPEGLQGAHGADAEDEFGQLARLFQEEADRSASGGMLVVIEEGSGVDDSIREVVEGALSEPGARLLACGNPTRPKGWFAEHQARDDRYALHRLDCRNSSSENIYELSYRDFGGSVHRLQARGRVEPRYWREALKDCDGDEDADYFRVRVRGIIPRSASEQVIKTHWVEAAKQRRPHEEDAVAPVVISLDFGLSSDKHALAARQGYALRDGEEWLPRDKPDEVTLDAAERAIRAQELYRAKFIVGDANGVGRGAMEYLFRYYRERPQLGVVVIFFNSGAGALDGKRFYRRRDEMWFKAGREWLSNPRCALPDLPGLQRQLTTPGYHEDTTRRIRVESKDEIKKRTGEPSGNLADALLMSLMVELPALEEPKPEAMPEHPSVFAEHFRRWERRQSEGALIR